jgi:transposase
MDSTNFAVTEFWEVRRKASYRSSNNVRGLTRNHAEIPSSRMGCYEEARYAQRPKNAVRPEKRIVDSGGFGEWAEEERGWRVEVPHHPDRHLWRYGLEEKSRGFLVLPRRWVVERTFAWLGQARRLAKDYERLPETGVAMIHWAMSRIMLRRLARTLA